MSLRSTSLLHVLALGALGLTLACEPVEPTDPDAGTPDAGPVLQADPTKSTVTLSGTQVPADGSSAFTVTVKLRHRSGGPLANKQVELQVTGEGNVITPTGLLTTDTQGEAEAQVASHVPGVKTLTVRVHHEGQDPQALTPVELTFVDPPLASVAFERQPGTVAAGQSFSQPVRVKLLDKNGQPWTTSTAVSISLVDAINGASLYGTLLQETVAGVAEFADLSLDRVGTGFVLRAVTAGGEVAGESVPFDVVPGPVASFKVGENLPAGFKATAGEPFALEVEAYDAFDNLATNFQGTLVFSSDDSQAGLPSPYTFTAEDQGVHTVEVDLRTAGSPHVTVTQTGSNISAQRVISVAPAEAARLRFSTQLPGKVVGTATRGLAIRGEWLSPEVQLGFVDRYDNPGAALARDVQVRVTLGGGTTGASLFGTTVQQVGRGARAVDFPTLAVDTVGEGFTLTASEEGATGTPLAQGQSGQFDVVASPCEAEVDPCADLPTTCNGATLSTWDITGTVQCQADIQQDSLYSCANATFRQDICNVGETCSVEARACVPSACAGGYDDAVACTTDTCDGSGAVTHAPNNAACVSGGTCSAAGGCVLNETDVADEADFCNLQWPPTLTVASGQVSESIYGKLYEAGLTDTTTGGAAAGVLAQVGFGPAGSNPTTDAGWTYTTATFNVESGNDDEYMGQLTAPTVTTATTYSYVVRFSRDNGMSWTYCDKNGAGSNGGLSFEATELGTLTVNP